MKVSIGSWAIFPSLQCVFCLGIFTLSSHVNANDSIQTQVYATVSFQDYELAYLKSSNSAPITVNLPMLGIGFAATYTNWFADFNINKSLTRTSESGSISADASARLDLERDTTRQSVSLSGGYIFENGLIGFLGYTQSKSDFDETSIVEDESDGITIINRTESSTQFSNSGPFMGAAYTWRLTPSSLVTLHSAIGRFSGQVTSEDPQILESNDLKTTGVSVGLKTKLILSGNVDASLGADWREFTYAEDGAGDLYKERVINVAMQVSYVF